MKFVSTRNSKKLYTIDEAIHLGLAPDGGLFVPQQIKKIKMNFNHSVPIFAAKMLKPYFDQELNQITKKAFNFKIPIRHLKNGPKVLELFHGPTCAFKDFAARFLAEYAVHNQKTNLLKTVLVATSGDTGGAVAAAFLKKKNFRVVILFPKGKISKRQEKQLTSFGHNVHAFAVKGTFDDCQKIVKSAFQDKRFKKFKLISANSVNLARILPQSVYYAYTSLQYPNSTFIIPTGNLGNATACIWAKKMGFPIKKIIFACNENKTLLNYYKTGKYLPKKSVQTLANAMDVGTPSNFERVNHLYSKFINFKKEIEVYSISDQQIQSTIRNAFQKYKYEICPHTATAFAVYEKHNIKNAILVSTAHPAKFEKIVEKIIHKKIKVPKTLQKILKQKSRSVTIAPNLDTFYKNISKL